MVIIFAPDTNPLKLPLLPRLHTNKRSPMSRLDRERHKVSEFIRERGRTDQNRRRTGRRTASKQNGEATNRRIKDALRTTMEDVQTTTTTSIKRKIQNRVGKAIQQTITHPTIPTNTTTQSPLTKETKQYAT
ncbi:MAG: hypothetical protein U0105_10885 [Candidatus Obscuribacterales bacterium]